MSRATILVVEDDTAIRRGLVDALTFAGYVALEAADGPSAASLAIESHIDLVLLDATDPFGGGAVLPAGRLREPPRALRRADLIVLTRVGADNEENILDTVRRHNPCAPVFRASTKLAGVFEAGTHRAANLYVLKQQPVLAFCGLGNPQAFLDDLRRWGFTVVSELVFRDHHRYTVDDLQAIVRAADRAGARALVTTEKDMINLTVVPPSHPPMLYCRIELEIEDEAGFFAAVAERLQFATD